MAHRVAVRGPHVAHWPVHPIVAMPKGVPSIAATCGTRLIKLGDPLMILCRCCARGHWQVISSKVSGAVLCPQHVRLTLLLHVCIWLAISIVLYRIALANSYIMGQVL